MTFTASPHPFPISLLPPHLQILVMALSLQDEDSVLQLLHSSLEQVVLLHHGTEAMLQLPLPVCQHFDLQGKERPCQTSQEPERRTPHSEERNETAKNRTMYTGVLYLYERNYLCVWFKA